MRKGESQTCCDSIRCEEANRRGFDPMFRIGGRSKAVYVFGTPFLDVIDICGETKQIRFSGIRVDRSIEQASYM